MPKIINEDEIEIIEMLWSMGKRWIVRQPNNDLMAFKKRPSRQVANDITTPWVSKVKGSGSVLETPVTVSLEREDFRYITKNFVNPISVLDIADNNGLDLVGTDLLVINGELEKTVIINI